MATTNLSLTKEKRLRLVYRILFTLIAFVAPLVLICLKFEVFTKATGYKISAIFILMLIVVLWRFKKRLYDWVISWEYSILKYILIGFSRVYLFIVALAILYLAEEGFDTIIFCLEWLCVCECISYLIIYPLEMKHDNNVKRLIRKAERKEDYKEAIKELEGE